MTQGKFYAVRYIQQEQRYCIAFDGDLTREQAEQMRDQLNRKLDEYRAAKTSGLSQELRQQGWRRVPVVDWDGTLYAILNQPIPHPGRNIAEVINVTEFNRPGKHFRVLIDETQRKTNTVGSAWILYTEVGIGIMTEYFRELDQVAPPELSEYQNPTTAVLTYHIAQPSHDQLRATSDQLDAELQETGPRRM